MQKRRAFFYYLKYSKMRAFFTIPNIQKRLALCTIPSVQKSMHSFRSEISKKTCFLLDIKCPKIVFLCDPKCLRKPCSLYDPMFSKNRFLLHPICAKNVQKVSFLCDSENLKTCVIRNRNIQHKNFEIFRKTVKIFLSSHAMCTQNLSFLFLK